MKAIYISGKIDGCEQQTVISKFSKAMFDLHMMFEPVVGLCSASGRSEKIVAINPVRIMDIPNGTWQDYIERDLIYLKHCDTIYMLKDWKDSAGARIEHEFAKKLGLEIIYEEGEQ